MDRKRKVVVLGATPAKKIFGEEDPLGKQVRLDKVFFEVIGLLEQKGLTESGHDPDDRAIIPLSTSMSRLTHQTYLDSIRIQSMSPALVLEAMAGVSRILRRNHNLSILADDDFRFVTPESIMEWSTESERALNHMLLLISTVSLFVGGIVIMNIMLVSIKERIHEIGIRRCFGARRSDISQQFLFESIFVSVVGGMIGVLLGLSISVALKRFDLIPTKITWEPFLLAFLFSTIIGIVFGIQPARKAASMSPEETLR
jgi:putative ABC transport system permease protein